jgi:hypothetical protein
MASLPKRIKSYWGDWLLAYKSREQVRNDFDPAFSVSNHRVP